MFVPHGGMGVAAWDLVFLNRGRRSTSKRKAEQARRPRKPTRFILRRMRACAIYRSLLLARVAELADAYGSGPYGETRGGSSPLVSTNFLMRRQEGLCSDGAGFREESQAGEGFQPSNAGGSSADRSLADDDFEVSDMPKRAHIFSEDTEHQPRSRAHFELPHFTA